MHRKWIYGIAIGLICTFSAVRFSLAASQSTEQVVAIVAKVQRADYEGNRAALHQLYGELAPYMSDKTIASRVAYWRGFALWRSAFNGFNDSKDTKPIADELQQALAEFQKSAELDPSFVDAKVGAISCLSNLMFLNQTNPDKINELLAQLRPLTQQAKATDPDNPRLLWVMGPNIWYAPPERGGSQDKAIATYERGLEVIRKQKAPSSNPLDPTWGEPELLMNLGWSNLNKTSPDLNAAQQNAEAALKMVPYWHYVRDILIPQIQAAKKTAKPAS
jgi:hypothetical protein